MRLHWFAGEKGGVGKSFACRTFTTYLLMKGYLFFLFDTDESNPELKRIYGDLCTEAFFSSDPEDSTVPNIILEAATERDVICNMPSQCWKPFTEWLERHQILSIAESLDVRFNFFLVTDCDAGSLQHLKLYMSSFEDAADYVIVKNFGKRKRWDAFEKESELQSLIKKYDVPVIELPRFYGDEYVNQIAGMGLSFEDAAKNQELSVFARAATKEYLKKAFQQFDALRLFEEVSIGQ